MQVSLKLIILFRFGTFLFNNERERIAFDLRSKAISLWTIININTEKY